MSCGRKIFRAQFEENQLFIAKNNGQVRIFRAHFAKLSAWALFSGSATGGDWGNLLPPSPKSRQKLSKKIAIKLVGYTSRLKNYVKIPPPPSFLKDISELFEIIYSNEIIHSNKYSKKV